MIIDSRLTVEIASYTEEYNLPVGDEERLSAAEIALLVNLSCTSHNNKKINDDKKHQKFSVKRKVKRDGDYWDGEGNWVTGVHWLYICCEQHEVLAVLNENVPFAISDGCKLSEEELRVKVENLEMRLAQAKGGLPPKFTAWRMAGYKGLTLLGETMLDNIGMSIYQFVDYNIEKGYCEANSIKIRASTQEDRIKKAVKIMQRHYKVEEEEIKPNEPVKEKSYTSEYHLILEELNDYRRRLMCKVGERIVKDFPKEKWTPIGESVGLFGVFNGGSRDWQFEGKGCNEKAWAYLVESSKTKSGRTRFGFDNMESVAKAYQAFKENKSEVAWYYKEYFIKALEMEELSQ